MVDEDQTLTDKIHNKRFTSMSRRRLMKHLTTFGFSGLTASYITSEDIKGAAKDEVPIVAGFYRDDSTDEEKPYVKYVSSDWYNDYRRVAKLKEDVDNEIGKKPGVASVGIIPGEIGGENSKIDVTIHTKIKTNVRGNIPSEIDGVEVEISETDGYIPTSCSYLKNWPSNDGNVMPGYKVKGDKGAGSVGAPVFKNGNKYIATCNHIFHGSNPTGKTLRHPDGTPIGTVKYTKCKEDYAMIKPNSNYNIYDSIANEDGVITGYYSQDGVADLNAWDYNVKKVGQRTCKTTFPEVASVNRTIWTAPGCISKPHTVVIQGNGSQLKNGDSGSMIYRHSLHDTTNDWLINYANYENSNNGNVFGLGIYRLNNFGFSI